METLRESIELDVDESNEMLFKVNVEGNVAGPARVRLVCESENDDMSYMFPGRPDDEGLVKFVIPRMTLKEGSYPSKIEVLLDNKYFSPVEFDVLIKKQVQVFAESVKLAKPIKNEIQPVKISISPIIKPKPVIQPLVIENTIKEKELSQNTLKDRYFQRKGK